ncbi:MAG: BMP family ABC transporter substrate-binding protein, partial [Anaerolinea sp.]|nr:BMP family ABC transporter substrate-binding protein [Anaerolinea sp.]
MSVKVLRVILAFTLVLCLGASLVQGQDSDKRVALIIAQGGLGDRSYNDSAFAGLTKAAADYGVQVVPIESPDPVGEGEQLLRTAAEAGFDLVITLEYSHFDPLARVAPDYPDTLFSIVNIVVDGPNVVSIMFDEHTGSYLAGALAEMVTTDPTIEQVNPTNAQALREKLQTAHALIARDDVVIDKALLDCAPILRVIGRVGASLSGIDVETATTRGIIVMNTPGVNAVAAGELTITL